MASVSNTHLILSMLQLIPRHPETINTIELREKLMDKEAMDIPLRNLQRYLNQVRGHFGLDCKDSSPGKPKQWFIANIERRASRKLSLTQSLCQILSRSRLETSTAPALVKILTPFFKSAFESLERNEDVPANWSSKFRYFEVESYGVKPDISSDVINVIAECLLLEKQLELVYKSNLERVPSTLKVFPLAVVMRGHDLFLVALDESNTSGIAKHYAMHQIDICENMNLDISDKLKPVKESFELNKYCENSNIAKMYQPDLLSMSAKIKPGIWRYLEDNPISEDQVLKELPDSDDKILECSVRNDQQLRRWILNCTDGITILEPRALHDEIQDTVVKMANNYRVKH